MSAHTGTHMDAPFHFIENGSTVENIPPARLIVPAVACDLTGVTDGEITRDHLSRALERGSSQPRPDGGLLLKTVGPDQPGRGIDSSAAELIVELGVVVVGTDFWGIDGPDNPGRTGHMILLGNNVLVLESLINVGELLHQEFMLITLPLPFQRGSGSPVRAVAVTPVPAEWV